MTEFDGVIAHPTSIRARRAYVAALRAAGDPHADLIERQLKKHTGLIQDWRVEEETYRAFEKYGREWAGELGRLATGVQYQLGLVAGIALQGDVFVERGAEIVRMAPIVHLALDAPLDIARVAATPALGQMRTLSISGGPWLDDDAMEAFAASPYTRNLRVIDFADGQIGERGALAIVDSVSLRQMICMELTGNPCCDRTLAPNVRLTEVMDRYYMLGGNGGEFLGRAYDDASRSYDPGGIHNWPPTWREFTYEE